MKIHLLMLMSLGVSVQVWAGVPQSVPASEAVSVGPQSPPRPIRYNLDICDAPQGGDVTAYVKFDLSWVQNPDEIISAKLILHPERLQNPGWLQVMTAGNTWNAISIHFHNQPGGGAHVTQFPIGPSSLGTHLEIPVTREIKEFIQSGRNVGFFLRGTQGLVMTFREFGESYFDPKHLHHLSESGRAPMLELLLQGGQGAEGPAGPQGPPGPMGPPGVAGATGPQGPNGNPGTPGVEGPAGPAGPVGAPGPTGPQGPQGLTGLAGEPGPQGIPGVPGTPGAQGPPGPVGATGPAGPVGPMGPQGLQGLPGVQGDVGPMGPAGPQGLQGVAGPVGPTGLTGPMGPQGPQGDPGPAGATGATGPAGPVGPMGPQGLQGPQGDPGPVGATGATGAIGPAGPVGPMGPQGLQGLPGVQGDVGPMGPAGPQGLQGVAGPVGPTGLTGPMGPQGPQGDPGPVGATGATGPAGPAGSVGPPGMTGPAGPPGPQGPAGENGPPGLAFHQQGCLVRFETANSVSVGPCRLEVDGVQPESFARTFLQWGCANCSPETNGQIFYIAVRPEVPMKMIISNAAPDETGYDSNRNRVIGRFFNNSNGDIERLEQVREGNLFMGAIASIDAFDKLLVASHVTCQAGNTGVDDFASPWIGSVSRTATGTCSVVYLSGIFSGVAPRCMAIATGGKHTVSVEASTLTFTRIKISDSNGTDVDGSFNLMCFGRRQ